MKNKLFSVFMAIVLSLSLMPAAAFAVDEEGEAALYPDAAAYYIGESVDGSLAAGTSAAYRVETASLYEQACSILVSNTSSSDSATLTFKVLDSEGTPKTEISAESASYGGSAALAGAESSQELQSNYWNYSLFNLSEGDFLVIEAGSSDASYSLITKSIYSSHTVECGEFYKQNFGNKAHLISLDLEDVTGKETVFVENNGIEDFRYFILADDSLVADNEGYDWAQLEPDYWRNSGFNFSHSKEYYLLIFPMNDSADYSFEDFISDDDEDYDDDDEDYYDDEDDYYYDDDEDYYDDEDEDYYDDDEDYYDDEDDEDYYDDEDDDYDYDDYEFAVAISPQDLKYYKINVSDKTYNGKAQKPAPEVEYEDILLGDAMYSVTYSNNKSVGTAKMTITGVAPNSGTVTKTFKINPKGTSLSKLTGSRKAITVKWKKQAAKMSKTRISGYEIQYSTSKKFTSAKTKVVKGYKATSKKLSGLKAKKKYYVRIRTYKKVGGKKYVSSWSKLKSIKTK